jgi:serine phosphatase RsbU (regulator of sigma subunit)
MTIRLRVALLTGLVAAVAVSLTTLLVVRRVNEDFRMMAARRVVNQAEQIAAATWPYLQEQDHNGLKMMIAEASKGLDTDWIHIADRNGDPLLDSRDVPGQQTHAFALRALTAGRPQVGPVQATTIGSCPIATPEDETVGAVVVGVRTTRVFEATQAAVSTATATGAIASVAGFLLAYLLAGYFLSPLSTLRSAIRGMASGDQESRLELPDAPELREVATAFNDMSTAVARRIRHQELLNLLAAEALAARRTPDVVAALRRVSSVVLSADAKLWVFDAYGEQLRSVPVRGVIGRVVADLGSPVVTAARESRTVLIGEDGADLPSGSGLSSGLLPVDSAVIVPLRTPDGVVGAMSAEVPGSRSVSREQISLAVTIANIVGPAVASLIRGEIQARSARLLQRMLIPPPPPEIPGVEIAAWYQPAEEIGRMGGDYYDFMQLAPGRWCFVMGDVSGKGLPAARYSAMAKYVLRSYVLEYESPLQAMILTNHALVTQMTGETFITLFCCIIDVEARSLRYVQAGHPPPVLSSLVREETRLLQSAGTPVGAFDDGHFEESEVMLDPGDTLVMYTDGMTEAHDRRELYGEERLEAIVTASSGLSAQKALDAVTEDLRSFTGGKLTDDVAIVVIKVM